MSLTRDQVKKVAKLANLPISEEEVEVYAKQLSAVLDYIEQLKKINTEKIEPTFNTSPVKNVFRRDQPSETLSAEDALSNASNKRNGFFVTKGVFEE